MHQKLINYFTTKLLIILFLNFDLHYIRVLLIILISNTVLQIILSRNNVVDWPILVRVKDTLLLIIKDNVNKNLILQPNDYQLNVKMEISLIYGKCTNNVYKQCRYETKHKSIRQLPRCKFSAHKRFFLSSYVLAKVLAALTTSRVGQVFR